MREIVSHKEAIARGLKRYFTGKACKSGHVSERVIAGQCCVCLKIKWKKHYQLLPPEMRSRPTKEQQRKYYLKHREKRCESARLRAKQARKLNPEHVRQLDRLRYARDRKKRADQFSKLYYFGPQTPKGDLQWLRKNQVLLRNLKRVLRNLKVGLPNGLSAEFQT